MELGEFRLVVAPSLFYISANESEAGSLEKIGKYEILQKIGQGGMGIVYKARDPVIGRIVAIKTLSTELDLDAEVRERFTREARSAGLLSHKNIITIYDLWEENGRAYIAMEYLDGEDLKSKIAKGDPWTLPAKLRLMVEICEGVIHAHENQVIHRDIKPGNVLVTKSGHVKILDFGLARMVSSDITRSGQVLGTPNYMSPEQIKGTNLDHRTDIFSLGVLFYELLTYRKPFEGDSYTSVIYKVLQADPVPMQHHDPNIPHELSDMIDRALQKEPEKRFQQVDEMLRELEAFRHSLGGSQPTSGSTLSLDLPSQSSSDKTAVTRSIPSLRSAVAVRPPLPSEQEAKEQPPQPSKFRYIAAISLSAAVLSIVLFLVFRPPWRKAETDQAPPVSSTPSPRSPSFPPPTPAAPADAELARTLKSARHLLETRKYSDAATEAQQALELAPDNSDATAILQQARERLEKIEQGNRQARMLHAAGKYEQATGALSEVLKIAPSDPEARRLSVQLDRYAQKGADEALAELKQVKSRSEEAGAPELAQSLFDQAKRGEQQAIPLYTSRQFGQASAKLFETMDLYRQAEKAARELRENTRKAAERTQLRDQAESARQAYERERSRAVEAGAEGKAANLFREASRLAGEGQASWEHGDFQSARRGYEAGLTSMQKALDTALKSRQQGEQALQTDLDSAHAALEAAKREAPSGNQRAAAEEARAVDLARQGKLGEAAAAFRQAASLFHSPAHSEQTIEVQRQPILVLLKRYEAAYVNKDLAALKNIWPGLGGAQERAIKEEFEYARSIQVDLQVVDIQTSGDQATVICRREYRLLTVDGRKPQSETRTTLHLKNSGGSWTIESIRFEAGR